MARNQIELRFLTVIDQLIQYFFGIAWWCMRTYETPFDNGVSNVLPTFNIYAKVYFFVVFPFFPRSLDSITGMLAVRRGGLFRGAPFLPCVDWSSMKSSSIAKIP